MTSKERVLAAFKREAVDYVPYSPFMNIRDRPIRLDLLVRSFRTGPSDTLHMPWERRRLYVLWSARCSIPSEI